MTNKRILTLTAGLLFTFAGGLLTGAEPSKPSKANSNPSTTASQVPPAPLSIAPQPTLSKEDNLELKLLTAQKTNISLQLQVINAQATQAMAQAQADVDAFAARVKDKYPGFLFDAQNIAFVPVPGKSTK